MGNPVPIDTKEFLHLRLRKYYRRGVGGVRLCEPDQEVCCRMSPRKSRKATSSTLQQYDCVATLKEMLMYKGEISWDLDKEL